DRARRQLRLGPAGVRAVREDVPQAERDARVHPDEDVFDGGHVGEEPDVLERPAHAEGRDLVGAQAEERLTAEGHAALVRGVEPGEAVKERVLAGPVRSDDRRDAALEGEVHAMQRGEAAEPLADASRLEERHSASVRRALAPTPARREDALRAEDHHQHQDDAEDHPLVLGWLELGGKVGQAVAEHGDPGVLQLVEPERESLEHLQIEHGYDGGAQDGAGNRAHAAEDDHGQHADRLEKRERLRVDEDLLGREQHAHDAGERGAAGERHELHPHQGHPHGPRRQLVLANRLPGAADVRGLEAAGDDDDEDHEEQDQEVEVLAVRQPEGRRRPRDGRDPLGAVGDVDGLVEIVGEHADDLAEAQGDDREVVAVQPEHWQAEQNSAEGRGAQSYEEERVEPPPGQREAAAENDVGVRGAEDGPGVRAHREEGHVAEVQEAGQPDDDVEAERQHHEDTDLGRHLEVVAVEVADDRHQDQERDHEEAPAQELGDPRAVDEHQRALEKEEYEHRARERGDSERRSRHQGDAEQRLGHARSRTTSPSRPLGRKMRIRISIENAKMSLYSAPTAPPVSSERYDAANASRSPSTRPPTIAPGMLPMPPSTAAVNALRPGMKTL